MVRGQLLIHQWMGFTKLKCSIATIIYRQYLNIHPNDFDIHKRLASTLIRGGKWKEAIDCFNYILEQNPDDAETLNEFGITLLKNNSPADAVQRFEQAYSF